MASDRSGLLLALPLHHLHGIVNGLGCALAVNATWNPAGVRRRHGMGPVRIRRDHGVHRGPDDVPPVDCRMGCRAARGAARLVQWRTTRAALQTLERWRDGNHRPHAARALRHDRRVLSNPLRGERRNRRCGPASGGSRCGWSNRTAAYRRAHRASSKSAGPASLSNTGSGPWRRRRRRGSRTGDVAIVERGYRLLGRTAVCPPSRLKKCCGLTPLLPIVGRRGRRGVGRACRGRRRASPQRDAVARRPAGVGQSTSGALQIAEGPVHGGGVAAERRGKGDEAGGRPALFDRRILP